MPWLRVLAYSLAGVILNFLLLGLSKQIGLQWNLIPWSIIVAILLGPFVILPTLIAYVTYHSSKDRTVSRVMLVLLLNLLPEFLGVYLALQTSLLNPTWLFIVAAVAVNVVAFYRANRLREQQKAANDSAVTPQYIALSVPLFLFLNVATLGGYLIYWWYQNWSFIKKRDNTKISPFWRGLVFSVFYCYRFFQDVAAHAKQHRISMASPKQLAILFLATLTLLSIVQYFFPVRTLISNFNLPVTLAIVTLLLTKLCIALPLIPVQKAINQLNPTTPQTPITLAPVFMVLASVTLILVMHTSFSWNTLTPAEQSDRYLANAHRLMKANLKKDAIDFLKRSAALRNVRAQKLLSQMG